MSAVTPWEVTMNRSVSVGYTYLACVVCTNGAVTVQKQNWETSLEMNCGLEEISL